MFLAPINFISVFHLVPVFELEPFEPGDGTTTAPTTKVCEETSADLPPPADKPETELRLVFKGFQWRAQLECQNFPLLPNCFVPDVDDGVAAQEDEQRRAREIEARHHKPDLKRPAHANGIDNAGDVSSASDPSESN